MVTETVKRKICRKNISYLICSNNKYPLDGIPVCQIETELNTDLFSMQASHLTVIVRPMSINLSQVKTTSAFQCYSKKLSKI